ncbi:MAG: DUF2922 domain-containing protein [Tissierellia bacterium]|nr:DUF2922 domain-containing protein [Tissierellia bacterium]
MDRTKLEMNFLDEGGRKFTLSVDDPRIDLTDEEVRTVMDEIISSNIFFTQAGDLVAPDSARIITTTIEELSI